MGTDIIRVQRANIKKIRKMKLISLLPLVAYTVLATPLDQDKTENMVAEKTELSTTQPNLQPEVETNETNPCSMPFLGTGRCRAAFIRYYYNPQENACKEFIYGGCGSNENNFNEMGHCMKTCGEEGTIEVYRKKGVPNMQIRNSDKIVHQDFNQAEQDRIDTESYYAEEYGDEELVSSTVYTPKK